MTSKNMLKTLAMVAVAILTATAPVVADEKAPQFPVFHGALRALGEQPTTVYLTIECHQSSPRSQRIITCSFFQAWIKSFADGGCAVAMSQWVDELVWSPECLGLEGRPDDDSCWAHIPKQPSPFNITPSCKNGRTAMVILRHEGEWAYFQQRIPAEGSTGDCLDAWSSSSLWVDSSRVAKAKLQCTSFY